MTDWKALEAGINKRRRMHELEGADGMDSRDRIEAVAGSSYLAGGQFWQLPNDSWGPEVDLRASREPVTAAEAVGEGIAAGQARFEAERQGQEQEDKSSDFDSRAQGIMDWSGSTREQAEVLINGLDDLRGDATDEEIAEGQARLDAEMEEAQARWDAGERTPEDKEMDARAHGDERFADDNGDIPSFQPEPAPPGESDAEWAAKLADDEAFLDQLDAGEARREGPDIVQDLPSWREGAEKRFAAVELEAEEIAAREQEQRWHDAGRSAEDEDDGYGPGGAADPAWTGELNDDEAEVEA